MPVMSLNAFDLNLLRVFDAVMEERSVQRAGQRIGLSQSAVSHALNRLRHALQDELFVRTPEGMTPTPRALEIVGPVRTALAQLEAALIPDDFDPSAAKRTFTLATSDYVTAALVPPLLRLMQETAPGVDLNIVPAARHDLAEQLDMGHIDVAITVFSAIPRRYSTLDLMDETEVYVARAGHPLGDGPLTLEGLAAHQHAAVVQYQGGQEDEYFVDRGLGWRAFMSNRVDLERVLSESGLQRRIAVTLPHFLTLPMVLIQSDMIAAMPRRLARRLSARYGLVTYEPPFTVQPLTIQAIWHSRSDKDQAQRWFRDSLATVAQSICDR
ncbi:LysR family transcriptional regulator [Azospirillum canadense]|uniref:LysR family transcriptional regulator n=1 Tax=Azospirillum canadense TaxID=403962 RepID=UPI002228083E|nr:LysR family transcriptional regulator [Azospirillum canadense]MCW2240007.1 DNA-binding transcriptional LysR family regulator [Azospirillum canadense]